MDTPQRTILITGCSSGIGHHCAHALHERGWFFYTFIGSGHCRLMCSWATRDEEIEALVEDIREVVKTP